jgi:hypothetical protein
MSQCAVRSNTRGLARAIGMLSCLALALPARAEQSAAVSGELQTCVARAAAQTRATGVVPGPARTAFLLSGDTRVFAERYKSTECSGFLAAGARHAQSLELVLQGADGRVLARSATPSTLAYAQHCGRAGELVFATLRMLDGQGEVVYVPLERAGSRPAALRSLEQCPALGTPRPAPLEVGPEPPGKSIDEQLELARNELGELGYTPERMVAYGTLSAGQHDARGLVLNPGRCYALIAVGSRQIMDLDLRVFGPVLPLAPAAADVSRRRAARVKLCAQAPARYVLDVSAFQGQGAYAIQSFELNEPPAVPGIAGNARIGYAEAVARMRARGLSGKVLTSGIVGADDVLGIPLSFAGGACYAVAAVDASESAANAIQLGLEGERGELLALDSRPDSVPLLYHCPTRDALLSAVVRPNQTRNKARFVLLVGSETSGAR